MKRNKFPLEIKLIIYEYFDPKDNLVVVDKYKYEYGKYIYIKNTNSTVSFGYNFYQIIFTTDKKIAVLRYTIQHFFLRQSQVNSCLERMKQINE